MAAEPMTITSSFTFDRWDEDVVLEEPGGKFVRTSFVKAITGEFTGSSRGEMIMAHGEQGAAAYSGVERVTGRAGQREGSFTLRHNAFADSQGGGGMEVVLMDGSGTGDFQGVGGRAQIHRHDDGGHTLVLELEGLPVS